MEENITKVVYDMLEASVDELSKDVAERDTLEELIRSGRYTDKALNDELYPKRDELRRKVKNKVSDAIQKVKERISQYKEDVAKLNNLNPDDLTDDIKLLQPNIILTARDINGMLERNKGNRTMVQVILRYAKEHKIDVGSHYVGTTEEENTADALEGVLSYYEKWMDTPKAKEMLDKFLGPHI